MAPSGSKKRIDINGRFPYYSRTRGEVTSLREGFDPVTEVELLQDLAAAIRTLGEVEEAVQSMRQMLLDEAPYVCKYCGAPSWVEPSEQTAPPDYCHESDHN